MRLPVVLRPEAAQDLLSARDWYDRQRAGLGDAFSAQVSAVFDQVAAMPQLFAVTWEDVRVCRLRRFPYVVEGQRVWLEAPDVGSDNGTHFPRIGAEWAERGPARRELIGAARCEVVDAVPLIDFARRRLEQLLRH